MNCLPISARLLLPLALLGLHGPAPALADDTVPIIPNWDDPALKRAIDSLRTGARSSDPADLARAPGLKLPLLGLPLDPANPTADEGSRQVREATRGLGAPKLSLPDCAKRAPTISMARPEGTEGAWYTRSYDYGCLYVAIAGTAETVPLEKTDELTRAALAEDRGTDSEGAWEAVDENDDLSTSTAFERTLTIANIPYTVSLECYEGAESFCADQAQRDALVDSLILVDDRQPTNVAAPQSRGGPEPEPVAVARAAEEAPASRGTVDFAYFSPGELVAGSGSGAKTRKIHFPGMAFPLRVGRGAGPKGEDAWAFANSQIYPKSGAAATFAYPWRDNYCESRSWPMPLCPAGKGHQGQDIRPSTKLNKYWLAVAMDDGVVTEITKNTTVAVRADSGYTCRYLHLDFPSISKLTVGQRVKKGQTQIGLVSNIMGGRPNTSLHLHFDCHRNVGGKTVRQPVYASLVAAYRTALGLAPAVVGDQLAFDKDREQGGGAGPILPPPGHETGLATIPKTEQTKNYGALTVPNVERSKWPRYLQDWPGLLADKGILDRNGDLILAFATEQSGVGAWWYWITQRKKHGESGAPTLTQLARGIAGENTSDQTIGNYVTQYGKLAPLYFNRALGPDEPISLADPETRWNLARTMFHHESGRTPIVSRQTFDCGIALGRDVIAGKAIDLARYDGDCSGDAVVSPIGSTPPPIQPPNGWQFDRPEVGAADTVALLREQVRLLKDLLERSEALHRVQLELQVIKARPGCGGAP